MSLVIVKNTNDFPQFVKDSCVCFGVFDGIHEGHRFEIESCISEAKSNNLLSCCITFDIDPDELFIENFYKLMSNKQRIEELSKFDVDNLIVFSFESIKNIKAIDFLNSYFGKYCPYSIHVGCGFEFGYKSSGNCNLLLKWGNLHNMKVHIHKLLEKDGKVISSTNLRKLRKWH